MSDPIEENFQTALTPIVDEPADDAALPVRKVVTRTAAKRALEKLGNTNLNLGHIEAKADFGQYVSGLGVFSLAAADYVKTVQELDEAIEAIVTLDAQLKDPEARVALMQTREKLLKQRGDLVGIGFKAGEAEKKGQTGNSPNNIPFPANTQVTQVSVHLPKPDEVKS